MSFPYAPMVSSQFSHAGGRMVTPNATLPLVGSSLDVDACAGIAKVTLRQRFENPHAEILTVTYKLPLPESGAVMGFAFTMAGKRTVGIVEKKAVARERYEEALASGKSAALLEQERTSLFSQEIGNIPPLAQVEVEVVIDMPLAWLSDGYWEFRFPMAAAPRYLNRSEDAAAVGIEVSDRPLAARASLTMAVRDAIVTGRSPESPSHPLSCVPRNAGFDVMFGSGNQVALDRDVVVRWPVAGLTPSTTIDVARGKSLKAFAVLTVVPPSPDARSEAVPRDVTLLLDTSGSMQGEPLAQLKRITLALIEGLTVRDSLELIEFSNDAHAFRPRAEWATVDFKREASRWVSGLRASGGTEMLTGIKASLASLRNEAQKQVILITDGLIGSENEVVAAILAGLPGSSRFHAIGVGAAANRSLIAPVARAGRGADIVVGVGEDAERGAKRLIDKTFAPAVVDLEIEGSAVVLVAPKRLPDLFAGSPFRAVLELRAEGGDVIVTGRTAHGAFREELRIAPIGTGHGSQAIAKLFAREMVEDLEMSLASGTAKSRIDRAIEAIGLEHQIATRLTSWVAVNEEHTVDPRDPSRRVVQPHELVHGMHAEGLGLRPSAAAPYPSMPMQIAQEAGMGAMPRSMAAPPSVMRSVPPSAAKPMAPPAPAMYGAPPPPPGMPAPSFSKAESAADKGGAPRDTKPEALHERAQESEAAAMPRKAKVGRRESERADDEESRSLARGIDAPRELIGRVALAKNGEIVIDFEVDHDGFHFNAAAIIVEVLLQDGRVLRAAVDPLRSTHAGVYGRGTWMRVFVMVDPTSATTGLTAVRLSLFAASPHPFATVTSQA
jgi:Ca-activated chloride channel homolog